MERTFIGERLRQARVARSMTAVALSEQVGVTPQALSNYERKSQEPRSDVLARTCAVLRMPERFFFWPLLPPPGTEPRFRALSAATKRARDSAREQLEWLREIVAFVDQHVELPAVDLPQIVVPKDPERLSFDEIDKIADDVRQAWDLGAGPIPHVIRLLQSKGVVVARYSLGASEVDAFSLDARERPYVVLNSEKDSCARSRFDACHELGHLILHREAPVKPIPDLYRLMENQAHRFSSAFLFPANAFRDELVSVHLDSLLSLKRRWLVSIGMMLHRAGQLQLARTAQLENIWRLYGRRGYRRREPLDDELPVEQPTMQRLSMQVLEEACGIGRREFQRFIPLEVEDLGQIMSLPANFFTDDRWGELERLRPRANVPRAAPADRDGDVIPFRRDRPN